MPSVLVLHPGTVAFRQEQVRRHRPLLAELGIRVALASEDAVPSDGECFDAVLALPPAESIEAGWERLRSFLERERIGAVLAQSERALPLGALAARELGVPGLSLAAALRCMSKHASRVALSAAGVPQPRFALVASAAEARRFAAQVGYPVVLKPVASAMSRLIRFVPRAAELDRAVDRLRYALPRSRDVERVLGFA